MAKTVCSNQSDPSKFRAARQRRPAADGQLARKSSVVFNRGSANRAGYGEIDKG
jgi:hypothetical protein